MIRHPLAASAALMLAAGLAALPAVAGQLGEPVEFEIEAVSGAGLASDLPSLIQLSDRMGTAHVAELDTALRISSAPLLSSYRAGDVAYWAAKQSLVVFTRDGSAVPQDLFLVGRIADDEYDLARCPISCTVAVHVSYESRP